MEAEAQNIWIERVHFIVIFWTEGFLKMFLLDLSRF